MSIYLKISRVVRNENRFIFFQNGNENCRVGTKKSETVGLAETQLFFGLRHKRDIVNCIATYVANWFSHFHERDGH